MGLPNPKTRKPTASEVVEWALYIAKNKIAIDVPGSGMGAQCWDLPNYLLDKYWGFRTWGNADAMAQKSNYRGRDFKIIRNTKDFIPQPGDWGVWTGGWAGHVNIVVGPCTKDYWYGVDQNWYTNNATGSPPYKIKHSYHDGPGGGVKYFVRPPYHPEKSTPAPKPEDDNDDNEKNNKKIPIWKDVTTIKYTISSQEVNYPEYIYHFIVEGNRRLEKPKGIMIRNAQTMSSVENLYNSRKKYKQDVEYPHFYVDRHNIWAPRRAVFEVPTEPDYIVIDVCEDYSASKNEFIFNEIHAMVVAVDMMVKYEMPLSIENLKVDDSIWRSMLEHVNWNMIDNGVPPKDKYEALEKALLNIFKNREKLLNSITKSTVTKSRIKVMVDNKNADIANVRDSSPTANNGSATKQPQIITETSSYTFKQALDKQMARGNPKKSNAWGWAKATRAQTSSAMNVKRIWESNTQRYQMLNLGKYQGVSVSSLNKILKGKGTLDGQGKAFAEACKKNNINEIYLIAHAFLESGYGTSNFASGRYGAYNYFGIGAYDNNPNYAMTFAKNKGWTTPAKAIMGGSSFVRKDYINKGQNTLYRIRWNPKNPATHQYATAIEWCQHQASTIAKLYKQIGLKGIYFTRDKYK
ncbi:TPA: glucosaminidase domain-containing protein [Staphylococcus aureus]|nr:glucosaminidase domain-containing protein [Staphylococcus aureus]HCW3606598.1 glucosaminidase domain-containing protein [Staphylococcus aureus]